MHAAVYPNTTPKPPLSMRLPTRSVTRHAPAAVAQHKAVARVRRARRRVADRPPSAVPAKQHDHWYLEEHEKLTARRFARGVVYQGHQTNIERVHELAHAAVARKEGAHQPTDQEARLRVMRTLQARFNAALYGRSLEKVFRRYDSSKEGDLSVQDLTRVVRVFLRMSPGAVSNEDIAFLVNELDADLSGSISLDELESFVHWGEKAFHSWVSGGGMVAAIAVNVASHDPGWQPPARTNA